MKTKLLLFGSITFLFIFTINAQVGIGNTNPQASLDISASSTTSPANNDGLLIPRMSAFPSAPGSTRDGLLIFYTGTGASGKGFYYWDQTLTSWVFLKGINDSDWYEEGSTNQPDDINDNIYTNGNVGIGQNTPANPLHIGISTPFDTAVANTGQDGIFIIGNNPSGKNAVGGSISFGGAHPARKNSRRAAISSTQTGTDEDNVGLSFYVHQGPINTAPMVEGMRLTHNSRLGINNTDPSANLDIIGTLQYEDGNEATGYVLTSDATGNAAWTDPNTLIMGVERVNDLIDGKSDMDGTNNGSSIFLGINAGAADDSSNNGNVGLGYLALEDNTTGSLNTAIGYNALLNNIDGTSNTAIGSSSLDANTTGIWNTAVGQASLSANVDGPYNTAVGKAALAGNLNGASNVAIGVNAFQSNTSGSFNTVIGVDAAQALTSSSNTIIGRRAMNSYSAGGENVAIGSQAGYYGSGIQNTYIGTLAGFTVGSPTRNGSVFLGYGAGSTETTSNKLYIENSASAAPLIYGEFDTNILRVNGKLEIGIPTGTGYAFPTTDGTTGQVLTSDGSGQINFTTLSFSDTQNTLDQAYDEGGLGNGNTINATDGIVTISGQDGLLVTGAGYFTSGATIPSLGEGSRMFFNPSKAAFRAGEVRGNFGSFNTNVWDENNVGEYSFAAGLNTLASGQSSVSLGHLSEATATYSVALGYVNKATANNAFAFGGLSTASGTASTSGGYASEAQGDFSFSIGRQTIAKSYGEIALGLFPTNYTASSATSFVSTDRIFTIGNGDGGIGSNALTIFKSGLMNINDAYNMPLTDGTNGQVMTSDGSGSVTWSTPTEVDGDVTNEIQDLSVVGDELQISGGGTSASMRAFINPKYPDGFANVDPITFNNLVGANSYTVPAGKNLYITNIYSNSNFADLTVDGSFTLLSRQQNTDNYQSLTNPIIIGPGSLLEADLTSVKVNGFLVDAYCEPITTNATYTVPAGKILVILNFSAGNPSSPISLFIASVLVYNGTGTHKNTAGLTSFINPLFADSGEVVNPSTGTINGYLIDK